MLGRYEGEPGCSRALGSDRKNWVVLYPKKTGKGGNRVGRLAEALRNPRQVAFRDSNLGCEEFRRWLQAGARALIKVWRLMRRLSLVRLSLVWSRDALRSQAHKARQTGTSVPTIPKRWELSGGWLEKKKKKKKKTARRQMRGRSKKASRQRVSQGCRKRYHGSGVVGYFNADPRQWRPGKNCSIFRLRVAVGRGADPVDIQSPDYCSRLRIKRFYAVCDPVRQ